LKILIKPKYKYNFKKRTFFYGCIGFLCISSDYLIFINLSKIMNPNFSNFFGYLFGSFLSYKLNKALTFKSQNTSLSLKRYCCIISLGLLASQIVILLGVNLLENREELSYVKLIAIMAAVSLQYLGNTFFGSNEKKSKFVKD
tara:strand:+ start:386 stop:814 length:429 start_codon:yes stop_codon:yes gene_type:complete